MNRTGKVILFTNARDELKLKEWVAHHLLLGFDFIYIFDHKSKIPLKGQFLDFNKDKFQVYVERCELDGGIKHTLITNGANIAKRHNFEWMLYLDADEFLVINNDKITNVKQLLSHYQYADAVSCNWLLFGSNFHIKEPDGLIIDNYIRSETTLSDTLKTFIRPSQFVTPDPHRPLIKFPNKAYHVNGRQLKNDADNYFYKNRINFEKAQVFIAHYVVQSEETYIRRKLNLPNDDRGEFRNNIITWVVDNSSNIDNLDKLHNDTINTLVKIRYSEKIKNYLENIK
jgi:hypothetical protein